MRPYAAGLALAGALALLTACGNAGADRIAALDATGELTGLVFVDVSATRRPDAAQPGAAGLTLALVHAGTRDTVATATTSPDGTFAFTRIPVGRYTLLLPEAVLADTFRVVFRDPPAETLADGLDTRLPLAGPRTIARNDTVSVVLGIGLPRLSVAAARSAAEGTPIFVHGRALTRVDEFGDASIHVRGGAAAIRAIRVLPGSVAAGDSVHVRGTVSTRAGAPVLDEARVFVMGPGPAPEPRAVAAETARTAGGGAIDAELVSVLGVTVGDTARVGLRFRIRSDEDTPLETMIHPDPTFELTRYGPGAVLDITGILVPDSVSGLWRIWPRSGTDVVVVTPAP
jgi:hypothetical protein